MNNILFFEALMTSPVLKGLTTFNYPNRGDCNEAYAATILEINSIEVALNGRNGSKKTQSFGKTAEEQSRPIYEEAGKLRDRCHELVKANDCNQAQLVIEKMGDLKRKLIVDVVAIEAKKEENARKQAMFHELIKSDLLFP